MDIWIHKDTHMLMDVKAFDNYTVIIYSFSLEIKLRIWYQNAMKLITEQKTATWWIHIKMEKYQKSVCPDLFSNIL